MFDSFNSSTSTTNNLKINAVSGTLTKTYKDSFFLKFHTGSKLADWLFDENPDIRDSYGDKGRPVVVIQTMLCGDKEMLVEVMHKKDFDKLFDNI